MKPAHPLKGSHSINSSILGKIIPLLSCFLLFIQPIHCQDESESGINIVDIEEFIIQMNMNENHTLFDVRTWMEYKKGRIPGAIHAGTSEVLYAYTDTMDFDQPIFLYCSTDFRSKPAGRSLASRGFKNIYILEPGFYGWKAAGKKIDKSKPPRIPHKMKK
jgi:rhodanese-related sulfurtransferase